MRQVLLALPLLALSSAALADISLDILQPLPADLPRAQSDFRKISEDLTAGLSYKSLGPAEATGIVGFGVGGYMAYTPVQDKQAWRTLTRQDVDAVGMAGVVVHKGLPFNIDLGAVYAALPGTDATLVGGEVRYALMPGSTALPALAIRVSHSVLNGVDDLDFKSTGVDVSISKGFTLLTPYAGLGYLQADSTPRKNAATFLRKETIETARGYVGLRIALGLFEITPEFEQVGGNSVYNLRLGLSI